MYGRFQRYIGSQNADSESQSQQNLATPVSYLHINFQFSLFFFIE